METFNWPPQKTLQWTFTAPNKKLDADNLSYTDRLRPFIKGYLSEFSECVYGPVSFHYILDPTKVVDKDNIGVITEFRKNPDGRIEGFSHFNQEAHYQGYRVCGICSAFHNAPPLSSSYANNYELCKASQCKDVAEFIKLIKDNGENNFTSTRFSKSQIAVGGQHFYKCECFPLGLEGWIIPVYIDGECVGCFSTGQYGTPKPKDASISAWYKEEGSSLLSHIETDDAKKKVFIEKATSVTTRIGDLYSGNEQTLLNSIRNDLLRELWNISYTKVISGDYGFTEIEENLEKTQKKIHYYNGKIQNCF